MRNTGIFFHYQVGERLSDFPEALEGLLSLDNVIFYDALYPGKPRTTHDLDPIPTEMLEQVHTKGMIQRVITSGVFDGALYSAAGTVWAAKKVWEGEIDNAFVFTGFGDHHAGLDSFGGGCYLNGAAVAINQLRIHFGVKRVAIVDTDAHHGNGTWEIFENDQETLYTCLCNGDYQEVNNKINIHVPSRVSDDYYLNLLIDSALRRVEDFQPEVLFWNWGFDGTQGDYGDIGISSESHARMALGLRYAADKLCLGRLIVVLCGGRQRVVARSVIPKIIEILANNR